MSSESGRIEFLLRRDGEPATRAWVERTLQLYRKAAEGGHGSASLYQPLFRQSIREFEQWLGRTPG